MTLALSLCLSSGSQWLPKFWEGKQLVLACSHCGMARTCPIPSTCLHLLLPGHTCRHCHHFVILHSIRTQKPTGLCRAVHTLQAWTPHRHVLSVIFQPPQNSVWELQSSFGFKLLPFFWGFYHLHRTLLRKPGAETLPLEFIKLSSYINFPLSLPNAHLIVCTRACTPLRRVSQWEAQNCLEAWIWCRGKEENGRNQCIFFKTYSFALLLWR